SVIGPPVAAGLAAKASTSPTANSASTATSATRSVVNHQSENALFFARFTTPPFAQTAPDRLRERGSARPALRSPETGRKTRTPARAGQQGLHLPIARHRQRLR